MTRRAYIYILGGVVVLLLAWKGKTIMNRAGFKKKFLEEIQGLDLKGFDQNVLLALASYESGDGTGAMAVQGNNIFSLQAPALWKGATIIQKSTGNKFRKYASWREAVTDFIGLMLGWPSNYATATAAARAGNITAFARALQVPDLGAKYAYGDPGKTTYASELESRYKSIV